VTRQGSFADTVSGRTATCQYDLPNATVREIITDLAHHHDRLRHLQMATQPDPQQQADPSKPTITNP
jgi:hypothetical protein